MREAMASAYADGDSKDESSVMIMMIATCPPASDLL
jgi:hypothetical protein